MGGFSSHNRHYRQLPETWEEVELGAICQLFDGKKVTDKELIIVRDSFGSSLAPLLAEGYKSIYVVDIRYVMPDMLGMFIDFEGKDVLFMYSALILNQKAFK